jgi:hypothetical protein
MSSNYTIDDYSKYKLPGSTPGAPITIVFELIETDLPNNELAIPSLGTIFNCSDHDPDSR